MAVSLVATCALTVYFALFSTGGRARDDERQTVSGDEAHDDLRSDGLQHRSSKRTHHASRASGRYRHHDWAQETDLQRRLALGLPGPNFWRDAASGRGPDQDPQLLAMWRSFRRDALQAEGEPELPFEPTAHRAELLLAEGDAPRNPTTCDVRVLPVRTHAFNCVVRVMCDGEVLYPNPDQTAGYVPCEIEDGRPVRAVDDGHSSRDGDPLVSLDLRAGTVTVEDRDESGVARYRATLRING